MNEVNEKLLLFKASKGDADAYGAIFDLYGKKVYRFIYFKVRTKEIAEDLSSQTFLKVWEHISGKGTIKQLKSYIYRVARNLIIDYYRSREKEELPLIYADEELETEININPDKEIDKKDLEKLLTTLKTDQREIIILRYIEELSIKEISIIVDKSAGHIRVLIHRALKDLRKYT